MRNSYYNLPRLGKPAEELGNNEIERLNTIRDLIPQDVKTILDVGCGDGIISNPLSKKYDIVGFDLSHEALIHIKAKKVRGNSINIPFKNHSFDLILCSDILEHLPIRILNGTIQELKRLCRKYIIINIPNRENLKQNYVKCFYCNYIFHNCWHLRNFSEDDIKEYFNDFKLIKRMYSGFRKSYFSNRLLEVQQNYGNKWFFSNDTVCPNCDQILKKEDLLNKNKVNFIGYLVYSINFLFNSIIKIFNYEKSEIIFLFKKVDAYN